jgi:hypothetical protein
MPAFVWAAPGSWAAMFATGDLNSLANGSTVFSSTTLPQIDTTTTRELYFQAEFVGGSMSPAAGGDVVVILLPRDSQDAAYVDGEASATIANQPVWMQYPHVVLGLRAKATSTQLVKGPVTLLPPEKYRVMLLNRAGVALAASGNQVRLRLLTEASV